MSQRPHPLGNIFIPMSSLVPVEISEDKQHILNHQFCATARIAYNAWSAKKIRSFVGFVCIIKIERCTQKQ